MVTDVPEVNTPGSSVYATTIRLVLAPALATLDTVALCDNTAVNAALPADTVISGVEIYPYPGLTIVTALILPLAIEQLIIAGCTAPPPTTVNIGGVV